MFRLHSVHCFFKFVWLSVSVEIPVLCCELYIDMWSCTTNCGVKGVHAWIKKKALKLER